MSDYTYTENSKKKLRRSYEKMTKKQLVNTLMETLDVLNEAHTCVYIADVKGPDDHRGKWEYLLDTIESYLRGYNFPP